MKNPLTSSNKETEARELNERLLERITQLTKQLEASEQARRLAELRIAQLLKRVADHEESLQKIGENWFTPSDITSVTYEATAGVCVNGISIRANDVPLPDDKTAKYMEDLAHAINRAKRLE